MNPRRRAVLAGLGAGALASCSGYDKRPTAGVPRSSWGDDATAIDVSDGIDLSGKLAVVTGCTSGIGRETLRVLALRGARVVGTSRSLERAKLVCATIGDAAVPAELELSEPQSVVACAETIRALESPVDILVLNAGFRGGGNRRELIDGVERHFAINHLGHFLLVNRLVDRMSTSGHGRIVVVASRTSYTNAPDDGIRFDDLAFENEYSDSLAYGHSKLANVLFSRGLARRLKGSGVTSNSLHPGVIDTEIDRNMSRIMQTLFGVLTRVSGKTVAEGAATSCFVATSPLLAATSGEYFEDCNAVTVAGSYHRDEAMSDRLWALSEDRLADALVPFRPAIRQVRTVEQ